MVNKQAASSCPQMSCGVLSECAYKIVSDPRSGHTFLRAMDSPPPLSVSWDLQLRIPEPQHSVRSVKLTFLNMLQDSLNLNMKISYDFSGSSCSTPHFRRGLVFILCICYHWHLLLVTRSHLS